MNVGVFVAADGTRTFSGTNGPLIFDLWRRNSAPGLFVLVRRFRITSDRTLVWAKDPPSESVPIGFMVPIEYWDDRVSEAGTLLWTA
jgi:hypothetical protein